MHTQIQDSEQLTKATHAEAGTSEMDEPGAALPLRKALPHDVQHVGRFMQYTI